MAQNAILWRFEIGSYGNTARPMSVFDDPSDTIAITEWDSTNPNSSGIQGFSTCNGTNAPMTLARIMDPTQTNPYVRLAVKRHQTGGMNGVFLDGHGKYFRLENTVAPTWMWGPC